MNKLKSIWNSFAEKYPSASKWIREGGLFVIVSNLITVLKYLMLLFYHLYLQDFRKLILVSRELILHYLEKHSNGTLLGMMRHTAVCHIFVHI